MTLPASDLMMATVPVLYTPKLKAAVVRYRDEMGFKLVKCAFRAHAEANAALRVRCVTTLAGTHQPELQRLSGPRKLQPWGAWEFSLTDKDANVLQFVQWVRSDSVDMSAAKDDQPTPRPWAMPAQTPKQIRRA